MEFKKFTSVYAGRLSIENLYALNKSTIDVAEPLLAATGGMPQAILPHLKADNEAMGDQMKKAAANVLTYNISLLDNDRDDRLNEVKRNVSMHILGRDELKKDAAKRLKIFLDPYWDADEAAMNTQTGVLTELFDKFSQNDSLQADADTLGISDMMAGLQTANTDFDSVYKQRTAYEAATSGPSASNLKTAAVKSYEQFCSAIEQASNFTPSPVIIALFNEMDELRKTYARLQHKPANTEPSSPAQPS